MNHTVLDSVALGYQPVWGRARQLAAVRLAVQVLHPESVDAEHLWRALGNDWPVAAPTLIIAPSTPELLDQALQGPALRNSWLEVPHAWFEAPDTLAQLVVAVGRGHQLLRAADLAAVRSEVISPLDVRSLLQLNSPSRVRCSLGSSTPASPTTRSPASASIRPLPGAYSAGPTKMCCMPTAIACRSARWV